MSKSAEPSLLEWRSGTQVPKTKAVQNLYFFAKALKEDEPSRIMKNLKLCRSRRAHDPALSSWLSWLAARMAASCASACSSPTSANPRVAKEGGETTHQQRGEKAGGFRFPRDLLARACAAAGRPEEEILKEWRAAKGKDGGRGAEVTAEPNS